MSIYESINAVMRDMGAVAKDRKNVQQGFSYRGVDNVMNALAPCLQKHGVFIVPKVLQSSREDRMSSNGRSLVYSILTMQYTFYAADGSSVECVVVGEGMDSGDKATNKAMAVAFKYACFQVFCIPTEEMPDPDAEVHEVMPVTEQVKAALAGMNTMPALEQYFHTLPPRVSSDKRIIALFAERKGIINSNNS